MVFDDEYVNWHDGDFMEHDFIDFYGNITEPASFYIPKAGMQLFFFQIV
jgi:hypothetical protein